LNLSSDERLADGREQRLVGGGVGRLVQRGGGRGTTRLEQAK
jgi:hypothetical protein